MDIEHISVSRKKCYDLCAEQYRFRYHLKLKPEGPEQFYFTYGKIVHKIAEEFVRGKGEVSINDIAQQVIREGVETEPGEFAPRLPIEYQRRLPDHLSHIRRISEKMGWEGELEHEFLVDLDPPNKRHVKGFIDRLINYGDNWFILDYKTTKKSPWRVEGRDVLGDLQLRCYAWVVQQQFKVPADKIHCALYYLEGGELHGAKYTQASLDAVHKELLQGFIEIQERNPETVRGSIGWYCDRCDYNKICRFYNPELL